MDNKILQEICLKLNKLVDIEERLNRLNKLENIENEIKSINESINSGIYEDLEKIRLKMLEIKKIYA